MAFFRKRKKMEEDVQKIKDAVEGKKIAEELTEKPEEPIEESLEKESPLSKTEGFLNWGYFQEVKFPD